MWDSHDTELVLCALIAIGVVVGLVAWRNAPLPRYRTPAPEPAPALTT